MKQLRSLIAVLCVFAFVAAACGGGDDSTTDEPSSTTTVPEDSMSEPDSMDDMDSSMDDMGDKSDMDSSMDDMGDKSDMDSSMDDMDDKSDMDSMDDKDHMIKYDHGIDYENRVIRVGVNTDLTGLFASLATQIAEAHKVYWEWINDNGGIQGWKVEPVILDNAYDKDKHLANYEVMAGTGDESVVMFSTSTGSPHTVATVEMLREDQMAAVPLTWYSGWADPGLGANVFELLANYCVEAMNGSTYMSETFGKKVAIATFPGDYGEDGAQGVKVAAEALGLEIVYDGTGAVTFGGADQTPVIANIVESGADWVWVAADPISLAQMMGGAAAQGFRGQWTGNAPTWHDSLLATGIKDLASNFFTYSTYTTLWGAAGVPEGEEAPGQQEMVSALNKYRPDRPFNTVYVYGWLQGLVASQILDAAITNGDITRAGVLKAANSVTADLKGMAPNQSWSGNPDDNIVRGTYIYDVDSSLYQPGKTIKEMVEAGNPVVNGLKLVKGPYVSETAKNWNYEPCFKFS